MLYLWQEFHQSAKWQDESMMCISSQQIRQRAYETFQERQQTGRKGDALSDWLEAEHEIRGRSIPTQASILHLRKPATLPFRSRGFRTHPASTLPNAESTGRSAVA